MTHSLEKTSAKGQSQAGLALPRLSSGILGPDQARFADLC